MIATLTLNPALDRTLWVDGFRPGEVNKVSALRDDAGGKGINVSKLLLNLGRETVAFAAAGGDTGRHLSALLDELALPHRFAPSGETRTNIKLVDQSCGSFTDLNMKGSPIAADTLSLLEEWLEDTLSQGGLLVMSGSIPPGAGPEVYARLVRKMKQKGIACLVDAEGEALRLACAEGPAAIKPNIRELCGMLSLPESSSPAELMPGIESLLAGGVGLVALSMGEEGALFVTREGAVAARACRVRVESTVGAGDAMCAGLAAALADGLSLDEAARLATAASAATVELPGSRMGGLERILALAGTVELRRL